MYKIRELWKKILLSLNFHLIKQFHLIGLQKFLILYQLNPETFNELHSIICPYLFSSQKFWDILHEWLLLYTNGRILVTHRLIWDIFVTIRFWFFTLNAFILLYLRVIDFYWITLKRFPKILQTFVTDASKFRDLRSNPLRLIVDALDGIAVAIKLHAWDVRNQRQYYRQKVFPIVCASLCRRN